MRVDVLDYACLGGNRRNEDAAGWTRSAVWVIDGATAIDDTAAWSETSGRWIATETQILLGELTVLYPAVPFPHLIGHLVKRLADRWKAHTSHVNSPLLLPPVCSLAMAWLRSDPPRLELVTIGDCVAVCFRPSTGDTVVVTETNFSVNDTAAAYLPPDQRDAALIADRREYIGGTQGLWVLSTNLAVAGAVVPVVVDDPAETLVLVASDGFARAVSHVHGVDAWGALLMSADRNGLHTILADLRRAESQTRAEGKLKAPSDDAAAVLACFR